MENKKGGEAELNKPNYHDFNKRKTIISGLSLSNVAARPRHDIKNMSQNFLPILRIPFHLITRRVLYFEIINLKGIVV